MKTFKHIYLVSLMLSSGSAFGMTYVKPMLLSMMSNTRRTGIVGGFLGCAALAYMRYRDPKAQGCGLSSWQRVMCADNKLPAAISLDSVPFITQRISQAHEYLQFIQSPSLQIKGSMSNEPVQKWTNLIFGKMQNGWNLMCRVERNNNIATCIIDNKSSQGQQFLNMIKECVRTKACPITRSDIPATLPEWIMDEIVRRCEKARQERLISDIDSINEAISEKYSTMLAKFYAQECVLPYCGAFLAGAGVMTGVMQLLR